MKRLALILSLVLIPSLTMAQQPVELNLKVTPAEADMIWQGLRELPVKNVEALMGKMRQQVMEQTQPKPVAPIEVEPKKE